MWPASRQLRITGLADKTDVKKKKKIEKLTVQRTRWPLTVRHRSSLKLQKVAIVQTETRWVHYLFIVHDKYSSGAVNKKKKNCSYRFMNVWIHTAEPVGWRLLLQPANKRASLLSITVKAALYCPPSSLAAADLWFRAGCTTLTFIRDVNIRVGRQEIHSWGPDQFYRRSAETFSQPL